MFINVAVPVALGLAAALVYVASANARIAELARLVFFVCLCVAVWRVVASWVTL